MLVSAYISAQTRYLVSSGQEFSAAQQEASAGDSIIWASGIYFDTRMDIDKDGIIVTAEEYGTVLFSGVSRVVINADEVTFSGIQYIGGFIGNLDVIRIYGNDVLFTHVNIQNYTCFKYLRVYQESRRCTISHCNFENRLNLDDQNILSILVDNEPGYHKIQYCSFKNFDGIGQDQGIEPIRIGVSTQGELDSRTLVEYCYFTRCNGDGEIISHKSRQNVYRYNTFENNPVAELVLRHGDEGIVYGNFFLNNMGGIRIREGSNHFVYNNYFEGNNRRSILLQNEASDPLFDIHIYHNTIVNSEEIILGSSGNNPPSNVIIANNIFSNPLDRLFVQDTGNETWIGNLSFGTLGITPPSLGLLVTDPFLTENSQGFYQPGSNSPAITAADDGYISIPLYPGMQYDNAIELDLMKESRPELITDRAIGASEFSTVVNVQPHATEMNTGPSYLFDNLVNYLAANVSQLYIGKNGDSRSFKVSSNVEWFIESNVDWISTDPTSENGDAQVNITVEANNVNTNRSGILTITDGDQSFMVSIFQDAGDPVQVTEYMDDDIELYPNPTNGTIRLSNLPSVYHSTQLEIMQADGKIVFSKYYQLDDTELTVDLDTLIPGAYLLNMTFIGQGGIVESELSRNFIKN
jgi:hypothetical protein